MKELYIEVINRFMESKQMKDYLLENIDILQKWQILDLICGARASLKTKYEMLKDYIAKVETGVSNDGYFKIHKFKCCKKSFKRNKL